METGTAFLLLAVLIAVVILGRLLGADARGSRRRAWVRERARRQVALWDSFFAANQPWHATETDEPHGTGDNDGLCIGRSRDGF
ncbi:MAG TPA: hypothetical protein VLH10_15300 [Yinghuangia sp.]|uniref:hypothetical protein n=1 Tax=Yinghuangia sp. YIM S10712 TaxID=3436930 RepID=UPI002B841465|nr:hypothetical protein [Yinghuangia sp.]